MGELKSIDHKSQLTASCATDQIGKFFSSQGEATRPRAQAAKTWSAVTCHGFRCFGDSSPKQGRVQWPGRVECLRASDGDNSPAESADKSAHSKVAAAVPRVD